MVCCEHEENKPALATVEEGEELSGGENLSSFDFSENAFGKEAKTLTGDQLTDFVVGNSLFRSNWVTAPASVQSLDGLGPMMNAVSCGSCHFKDGRAKPPETSGEKLNGLLFRLSVSGQGQHGQPLDDPNYGGQLQDKSILGVDNEADIIVSYEEIVGQYADGTSYHLRKPHYTFQNLHFGNFSADVMVSPRIAQQLPGLGLLENISAETILSFADEHDSNGDGISGKPNYVWDEKNQKTVLGRFGWKANQPSILQQTAGAFNGDMGITTTLFPGENLTAAQKQKYTDVPNGGEPEIDDNRLDRIIFYIQTLSVPARRDWENTEVLRGKKLFADLQCSACHISKMQTSSTGTLDALNTQTIRPYTDLLLHDMGPGLADNRPDYLADGNEWRTPPLWGLGLIKTVNKHTYLLHDGRARNMEEAILWHGGEGENSKVNFTTLPKTDREALLKFLESL
jgi:CxxC motif-containing protein (DUF1111 family)